MTVSARDHKAAIPADLINAPSATVADPDTSQRSKTAVVGPGDHHIADGGRLAACESDSTGGQGQTFDDALSSGADVECMDRLCGLGHQDAGQAVALVVHAAV